MMEMSDTRTKILDLAQELCQQKGHRGFSFRDIAKTLGIKSASVHHHFETKEDLLLALIERYRNSFESCLKEIDSRSGSAAQSVEAFFSLLENLLASNARLCLCGMLASESEVLSPRVRDEVSLFFQLSSQWLTSVLTEGANRRELQLRGNPEVVAIAILSSVQGMLITSRVSGGAETFRNMANWLRLSLFAAREETQTQ